MIKYPYMSLVWSLVHLCWKNLKLEDVLVVKLMFIKETDSKYNVIKGELLLIRHIQGELLDLGWPTF